MRIIQALTNQQVPLTKMDTNKVRMFLQRYSGNMPELKAMVNNSQAINAIAVVFQAFANNSENIASFFSQFRQFIQQNDSTPAGETVQTMKAKTEAERNGPMNQPAAPSPVK